MQYPANCRHGAGMMLPRRDKLLENLDLDMESREGDRFRIYSGVYRCYDCNS